MASPDAMSLISTYGYWAVAVIVGLESMGLPLPGETTLLAAAAYAGSTHRLSIVTIVAAAVAGAILGDNLGFWIGRSFGYRLLLRYGSYVHVDTKRVKLGQYLFLRHGGKVVFFGRFIAVLRALAAFLAGANRMPWEPFLLFNAAGAVAWASLYGLAAYVFGKEVHRVLGGMGLVMLVLAVVMVVAATVFLRRHESQLQAEAERALPGPLQPPGRHRRVSAA
jgi:membrane protein DedA with SNARE-associated domain